MSLVLGKMDSHQAMPKQNLHTLAGKWSWFCSPEVMTRIPTDSWSITGLPWHIQHSIYLGLKLIYFDLAFSSVISDRNTSQSGWFEDFFYVTMSSSMLTQFDKGDVSILSWVLASRCPFTAPQKDGHPWWRSECVEEIKGRQIKNRFWTMQASNTWAKEWGREGTCCLGQG